MAFIFGVSMLVFGGCRCTRGCFTKKSMVMKYLFFPTCQVRVVRFYVSLLRFLLLLFFHVLLRLLRRAVQCPVSAGNRHVQCQPATAIVCAQCSLPDLNRDSLRSVFPAGPQPRSSALSKLRSSMLDTQVFSGSVQWVLWVQFLG